MKMKAKKRVGILTGLVLMVGLLTGCNQAQTDEHDHDHDHATSEAEVRAIYDLDRLVVTLDGSSEVIHHGHGTPFDHATLTFVGEEQGGNVLIHIGDTVVHASINPSREHPSYAEGYWHHHLYAGSTQPGSPRINFQALLPELGIDDHPEATDDRTQSAYQHGNLHYVVETGEFRLRFSIDQEIHDLMFVER